MKEEIYQLRGQFAVLEKEFEELCIRADNSIITIREKINPVNIENDFLDLKIVQAAVEMNELKKTYLKAREIKSKIVNINARLDEMRNAL